jgi:predicted nucleotidyltransferase
MRTSAKTQSIDQLRHALPHLGESELRALAEILAPLIAAYEPERIYLFGSRARGDQGPNSDFDLMVVVTDSTTPQRQRSRLAYEVLRGTGTAADVLVLTRTRFESRLHLPASLPATVTREGKLLYAA